MKFSTWLETEYTPWGVPRSNSPGSSDLPDAALDQQSRERRVGRVLDFVNQLDNMEFEIFQGKFADLVRNRRPLPPGTKVA